MLINTSNRKKSNKMANASPGKLIIESCIGIRRPVEYNGMPKIISGNQILNPALRITNLHNGVTQKLGQNGGYSATKPLVGKHIEASTPMKSENACSITTKDVQ